MTEASIHKQICKYISLKYPEAIFNTDLSGIKLTMGQAVKVKKLRSSNSMPDIVIYEPRGQYCGLFIEVKRVTPYTKVGGLRKNEHLEAQENMLIKLTKRGYKAKFVWTFEMAKEIIDKYLCT